MGTENRRLYSVGDTADDFLRPHPPTPDFFHRTLCATPLDFFGYAPTGCLCPEWASSFCQTASATRRLDAYGARPSFVFSASLSIAKPWHKADGFTMGSRLMFPSVVRLMFSAKPTQWPKATFLPAPAPCEATVINYTDDWLVRLCRLTTR